MVDPEALFAVGSAVVGVGDGLAANLTVFTGLLPLRHRPRGVPASSPASGPTSMANTKAEIVAQRRSEGRKNQRDDTQLQLDEENDDA